MTKYSTTIAPELMERVVERAREEDMNLSEFIEHAFEMALADGEEEYEIVPERKRPVSFSSGDSGDSENHENHEDQESLSSSGDIGRENETTDGKTHQENTRPKRRQAL